jgi:chromosome segregation ATPase
MKKLLVIGAIVLAGLFVLRKTHVCSYAGTMWSHVKSEANARMDDDIRGAVGPIAEHMAAVSRLKRDIEKDRTSLTEQKTRLLRMTEDLKNNREFVTTSGERFPPARVRQKLDRDFASYKRLEAHLGTQEKLLEAKERALESTREQLNKLHAKKQEFQVRLAQMETEYEALKVAAVGNSVQIDSTRAAEIEAALRTLGDDLERQRYEVELRNGQPVSDSIAVQEPGRSGVDLEAIRNYLEGNPAGNGTTTASQR